MAVLTFPAGAVVTQTDMALLRARIIHQSPESLERAVTDWGGAKWRGQTIIGPAQDQDQRAIEAFLASWSDPLHSSEIPTGRQAADLGGGSPTKFSGASLGAAGLQITPDTVGAGTAAGQLCRIGARTYKVVGVASGVLTLEPAVEPATGVDTVRGVTTVLASIAQSSGLPSRLRPRWGGPWTLSWDEAL